MDWQAFWLTIRLAFTVTLILLLVGLPLAYWIAFSRWRWKFIIEAVVALPIVLPPTVLGFYVLVALGQRGFIGRWWQGMTGHTLAFTFSGLVIGSVLYSLPFAVQPLVAGFKAVDAGYVEAAEGLGVRPFTVFLSVVLPLARASLLTSAVLAFTHTVGEFGVVLMLGGNIPGATRTLSISLYDQVQEFNYAAANRTALLLLAISLAALLAIYLVPALRRAEGRQGDVVR